MDQPEPFGKTFNNWVKNHRAQLLSNLTKQVNDLQLAEDVLQDALEKAWSNWKKQGLIKNPKSWILKSAYNQAIDVLRRQQNFNSKQPQITHLLELLHKLKQISNDEDIADERLRLIFTCCHPALEQHTQVALTLNTVCGFTTEQIAKCFLIKTTSMAQRLVRAKRKIKRSGISFKVPDKRELKQRLDAVLSVIYLIYNQGYYACENEFLTNNKYSEEGIYLALTLNQLLPNQAELLGLLALMHFHLARTDARSQTPNSLTSLANQDRELWDHNLIKKGDYWFQKAIRLKSMGPYQIQAAISGVHNQAKTFAQTNWEEIILLYEKLYQYLPTNIVQINLAVAMSYNQQSDEALALLTTINDKKLLQYLPLHLAKAQVFKSLGQKTKAFKHLTQAMLLSRNQQETMFIKTQLELLNH